MKQLSKGYVLVLGLCFGLVAGTGFVSAQSEACVELRKDISEIKTDLNEYKKDKKFDPADRSDLEQTISEIKKDLNEYLSDPDSDPNKISKANYGLEWLSEMQDGINKRNIKRIVSSYAKLIELYEWFYHYEGCK